jgi:hypothetical protein
MLNEKDLQLFEYNDSLKSFLQSIPRYEIIEVVQLWFTIPELRPTRPDATFDAYLIDERNKSKILERVTILDWVNVNYFYLLYFINLSFYYIA